MELSIFSKLFGRKAIKADREVVSNLSGADIDHTYEIKSITTDDKEMENFLFSLGCFEGERITLISVLADNYIVNIKDARYCIDTDLARSILI